MTQEEAQRRIHLSIDQQLAGDIENDWECPCKIQVDGPVVVDGVEYVQVITSTGAWLVAEDGSLTRAERSIS